MNLDFDILLWINGHYSEWLDGFMWTVSRSKTWIPLYVLLVIAIGYKYRSWKAVLLILLGFSIAVGLSDFTTSGIIKPLVERLRPTHEPALDPLHLVARYTGGKYGFCSSHAANTMSVALLFSLLYRHKITTAGLMIWVVLNCYSRMYLGVHYPSDILVGLLIGSMWAVLVFWALRKLHVGDAAVPRGGS